MSKEMTSVLTRLVNKTSVVASFDVRHLDLRITRSSLYFQTCAIFRSSYL